MTDAPLSTERLNIYLPPYRAWSAVSVATDGSTQRWFGDSPRDAIAFARKSLNATRVTVVNSHG